MLVRTSIALAVCAAGALAAQARAATLDDDVEWLGVSHFASHDRRPLVPVDGEAFEVRFQAYQSDISAANVIVDDGAVASYPASEIGQRGPYAIWSAAVPATAASALSYYIELIDGSDADYYSAAGMSDAPPADGGFVIDFATLSHAPLGATPLSDGGTVFRVWAPNPNNAFVAGPFNNWSTIDDRMARDGEFFTLRLAAAHDRDMYKYVFKPGPIWKPDARARALNPGDNYNTFIEDPLRYAWVCDDFSPPPAEQLVLYELHVGTFSGRNDPVASGANPGTYLDVAAHVADLVELGVNAVELMPVTEFPWDFSAGYNPVTAYAPEWRLGDPDDLKFMVDTLHQHGIAVLLDIVWNHFSPTDNYLWDYDGAQIYFDSPAVETPWGAQADFDAPQVRAYFLDAARFWLEEMRLDGFRMDATDFMNIGEHGASGWSLMQALNDLVDNRWADKTVIAEQLPDDAWVTRPTGAGGAGFDSQWHDAFTDQLRSEVFDAALGDPEMWRIANIINGSGTNLEHSKVVNYLELHDEAWPSSGGQRIVQTIDTTAPHDDIWAKGRVKLAQGVVMTAPGIPMILQGSEWLESTGFGGGDPSGADRINWANKAAYAPIFAYFRDIIAARRSNPALWANSSRHVYHVNEDANVLAFRRERDDNDIVVVASFNNGDFTAYDLGLPRPGKWYELVNSQAPEYDGNGLVNRMLEAAGPPLHGFGQSATIQIPQMGLLVLRHTPCPTDLNGDGFTDLSDLAIQLSNFGTAGGAALEDGDVDGDRDIDLSDLSQMLAAFGAACG